MARPKKPRNKPYRPRPVSQDGGMFVLGAVHVKAEDRRPMHADDVTDLSLAYRLSLDAMVRGESTEEHWSVVTCSLNIGLILCERGIGSEYEPMFVRALGGAFRARVRGERTGAWRFDGEALAAIREALDVHDEQVQITTKEEMRTALLEVRRRVEERNVYELETA